MPSEVDVLIDGVGEDHVVLEHHAELLMELLQGDGRDLPTTDLDQPSVSVIQPHEQCHQGGLTAACGTDDAQSFPGAQAEGDVLHVGLALVVIGEGHLIEHHVVGGLHRILGSDQQIFPGA